MRMSLPHLLTLSCVLAAAAALPAQADMPASIRSLVSIDRSVVKVKDLFRNAGSNADVVLGPAPPCGGRITVGSRQLDAIAKQYQVAWDAGDRDLSVVVERPGVPVTAAQIRRALLPALIRAGAASHSALSFTGAALPMIPPTAAPHILVGALAFDRISNDFSANILITAPAMNAVTVRITGMASPAAEAVVAIHRLSPGEILGIADLKRSWIPAAAMPQGAIGDLSQAIGMQVTRMVPEGAPVSERALASPTLIARGATVSLTVDMPGLEVTAQGIALGTGGAGSVIAVLNPTSHEVVQAVTDGSDHAHVLPGSMPMPSHGVPYYQSTGRQP